MKNEGSNRCEWIVTGDFDDDDNDSILHSNISLLACNNLEV
jgi:hypothetical protein